MTPSFWILSLISSSLVSAGPLTWQIPTAALNAQKGVVVDPTDHTVYQWQKNAFAPAKVMIGTLSPTNGLNGIQMPPMPQPQSNQQKQMPQMPSMPGGGAGNGNNPCYGNSYGGNPYGMNGGVNSKPCYGNPYNGNQDQSKSPDKSNQDKPQPRADASQDKPAIPDKTDKPEKSKKPDDGLCTANQKQSDQVQSGKCDKLKRALDQGCANNQVRNILGKAGQMKDIQKYCPNFATYGDSSAKQEALRQLMAAIIQKNSQWKDANGLFKIGGADFKKYQDCRGLNEQTAKDPDANLKCGSCKVLTEMARSGSFSSSSSDPAVAAALKSYCEGRPKPESTDGPGARTGI